MPIGKNAIKRVDNNGYSNVKTTAPDMENSNVIANVDSQVIENIVKPIENNVATKKTTTKTIKKLKKANSNGFNCIELGSDLPYFLL